jgi:hypothetical protein
MPSAYIHLAGEDVDEAQCILCGTVVAREKEEPLKPQVCERCHSDYLLGSAVDYEMI